jgi:hypothetical protein
LRRKFLNKKNTGVQKFRSSGVQEFRRILNPGQTGDRSDLTGLFLGYNPHAQEYQWLSVMWG